jgi:hypothetical protein
LGNCGRVRRLFMFLRSFPLKYVAASTFKCGCQCKCCYELRVIFKINFFRVLYFNSRVVNEKIRLRGENLLSFPLSKNKCDESWY